MKFKTNFLLKLISFLPLLLSLLYLNLLAKEKYESSMTFNIREMKPKASISDSFLIFNNNSNGNEIDTILLQEYIKSEDLFIKLDKKFNLINYYKSNKTDIIDNFNLYYKEDFLELYRESVSVDDLGSGIRKLNFVFYDKLLVKEILAEIVIYSEKFINDLEEKRNNIYTREIESETIKRRNDLTTAKEVLKDFQIKNKILDPNTTVKFDTELVSNLTLKKIEKKSELEVNAKYVSNENIKIKKLENEIIEINELLDEYKRKMYNNEAYLNLVIKFEEYAQDLRFKFDLYKTSITSYEVNIIENKKNNKYFETITKITEPDKSIYPNSVSIFISTLILSLVLYFIISFIVNLIKEHK